MKISGWLIVAVVVIWFLFFYKSKKAAPQKSAATNTPLDNLAASIAGSNAAADLVARVVDASQGRHSNDIYDEQAIIQTQVKGGDFINVIPETDKIFAKTGVGKKKRDQMWWPKVMYDESPAWSDLFTKDGFRIETCKCGCGDQVLIKS